MKKSIPLVLLAAFLGASCSEGDDAAVLAANAFVAEVAAEAGVGAAWFLSDTGYVVLFLPSLIEGGNPGTYPCDAGSVTLAVNDTPPVGVMSPGDSVTFTMNKCGFLVDEEFGVSFVYDGTISCVVQRAVQSGPSYDLAFAFTFSGFEMGVDVDDDREETLQVDGDLTVELVSPDGTNETATMRTGSLHVVTQSRFEFFSREITNYEVVEVADLDTAVFRRSIAGTVSDDVIGGAVTVHTTVPLDGTGFDPGFPATGEVIVQGSSILPVRVVVRDNIRVELQVDETGDGEPDLNAPATWADLNWFISRDLMRTLLIF